MKISEDGQCPTFRPTRAAFERPFCEYVRDIFKKHPDLACFKVIPPKGWSPWRRAPNLDKIRINTPIKQHVFGKGGAYVAILEEQRSMTAADFKRLSERPQHQPPAKGHREDELHERAFWSSITNSPPLYGADTPVSLFDEKVAWGWNLRHLGCMLQDEEYDVPNIPGVTSPMTYFGMWKSFFGWHKEDIDLYSINYVHFGAPKVWYCVSPKDNARFDAMAQSLYPDLYRNCHGFMRHKDVVISPKVLRAHNVPYVQAKQEAGEFIVLNAAAYHAGYNLGFNCAEAVNFAMEEWLDAGRAAVPCTCSCLPDGVALDMGIFIPELREEDSSEEEEEEESDGEEGSSDEEEGSSSGEEESEEEEEDARPASRRRHAPAPPAKRSGRRAAAPTDSSEGEEEGSSEEEEEEEVASDSGSEEDESEAEEPPSKRRRAGLGRAAAARAAVKVPEIVKAARGGEEVPKGAAHPQWGKLAEERPLAVVERDDATRQFKFSLVHRLARPSSRAGAMWVGLLKEDPADGLYRPQGASKLLQLGAQYPRVVHVRSEWQASGASGGKKRAGGWSLKTKPERILMVL